MLSKSRLVFYNCGGHSNFFEFLNSININEYKIICLAEHWMEKETEIEEYIKNNYNIYFSKATRINDRGRASGGIYLFCSKEFHSEIVDINKYWIVLRITYSNGFCFFLGGLYFPPGGEHQHCFNEFSRLLDLKLDGGSSKIVLLTDCNARIGSRNQQDEESFFDCHISASRDSHDKVMNARGRDCIDFIDRHGLLILNGRTLSDSPANYTYVGSNGKSVIDLAMVGFDLAEFVGDSGVLMMEDNSDHFPYFVDLILETPSVGAIQSEASQFKIIWDNRLQIFYNRLMQESLCHYDMSNGSIDECYAFIQSTIIASAKTLGLFKIINSGPRYRNNKPWFDANCITLKTNTRTALKDCKSNGFNDQSVSAYVQCKKLYKSTIKTAKLKYWTEIKNEISSCNSPSKFWQAIKKFSKTRFIDNSSSLDMVVASDYFTQIFNCFPGVSPFPLVDLPLHNSSLDSNITMIELQNALQRLKTNKAPGLDRIPGEFFKYLNTANQQFLLDYFNRLLQLEQTPSEWSKLEMFLIYKKGDKKAPSNFRGISLLNTITKLFTSILATRITLWAEENSVISENQNGFRQGRGCNDSLFVLSCLINEQLARKGSKLYAYFVDFKQAFDRVPHDLLWNKLGKLGISTKILNILKSFYQNAFSKIKIGGKFTNDIPIKNGVLQGDTLSPLLFALYLADFETFFRSHNTMGFELHNDSSLNAIFYADDLVVVATSRARFRKQLRTLHTYCLENRLEVNTTKSKALIFRRSGRTCKNDVFNFNDSPIEIVSEIEYLGVIFSNSGKYERAARSAVSKASFTSHRIRSLLQKSGVDSARARVTLFDSAVKSTLLYGVEVWGLQQEALIEGCQTNFLKSLYFLPRSTPGYILRKEFCVTKLIVEVLKRAIRWFQKTMAMDDLRLPKVCLMKQLKSLNNSPVEYNWLSQLRNLFLAANSPLAWENLLSGDFTEETLTNTLIEMRKNIEGEDENRILNSSFCPLYKHVMVKNREFLMSSRLPLSKSRILYQLITSNSTFQSLYCNGVSHRFNPLSDCLLCSKDSDSLEHFLLSCPCLSKCRTLSGVKFSSSENTAEEMAQMICTQNEAQLGALWKFLVDGLETRRFMERMLE